MAGLSRNNIATGVQPEWPRASTPEYYYGVSVSQSSSGKYFPGFDNDSLAGSSIMMILNSGSTDLIKYYNGQGVQITDGVWDGGYSNTEAWQANDIWVAHYMDAVDNKLYSLMLDTTGNPDSLRMVSVDKDGTHAYETAAFTPSSTAWNNKRATFDSTPSLYRVGGADGTGNFRLDLFWANTDNNNNAAPYDGAYLEINTSGSTVNSISANTMVESTADGFMPNNFYLAGIVNSMLGPTDNNIMGGPYQWYNADYNVMVPLGYLINMTTGQMTNLVPFGTHCPIVPATSMPTLKAIPWLGNYHFTTLSTNTLIGQTEWERGVFHNFMDEMAVYYGIL